MGARAVRHPAEVESWRAWHASELAWYAERSESCFEALDVGSVEEIGSALQELVGHRINRHLIAEAVEGLIDSNASNLRLLACTALGQIGSRSSVPALTRMADDEDERVVREAERALEAIRGLLD